MNLAFTFGVFVVMKLNIFSKLALGALTGFEYVAIVAGECRAPARNIARSVIIAAPIIALMFILGTFAGYEQAEKYLAKQQSHQE